MKKMMNKISFLTFFFSALMSTMCWNWFEIWILMEINMIAFSLFISKKSKFEVGVKYFSIQILSSVMILSSFFLKEEESFKSKIMFLAIMLKTSSFPFFSWSLKISEKISWKKILYLTTTQKIISIVILMKFNNNNMELFILMNMMMIFFYINIWKSSKKMIMISSINNFSWILVMNMSLKMTMMFFLIYSMTMFFLTKKLEMENNKNMNFSKKKSSKIVELISISGIPPLTMFFVKWKISEEMFKNNNVMMIAILFFLSSIMTMLYFKINFKMMFKEKDKMMFDKKLLFLNCMIFWNMSN